MFGENRLPWNSLKKLSVRFVSRFGGNQDLLVVEPVLDCFCLI